MFIVALIGCASVSAWADDRKVVVMESPESREFVQRLNALNISTACLSASALFVEKQVFLYEAIVVLAPALEQEHYQTLQTFVLKGGIFIPIEMGANVLDMDANQRVASPPDIIVTGKGGLFYEMTGGTSIGGSYILKEFSIVQQCPITEGFSVGERIQTNIKGMSVLNPSEGTLVCCGRATLLDASDQIRSRSVIQVKRYGKGAGLWVTAKIHNSSERWADTLLRNIFSEKTFEWCRAIP